MVEEEHRKTLVVCRSGFNMGYTQHKVKKERRKSMSKEFRKAFEESLKENDAVLRELAKL